MCVCVCLIGAVFACCLPVRLFRWLLVYLCVCSVVGVCAHVCLFVYLFACLLVCLFVCLFLLLQP